MERASGTARLSVVVAYSPAAGQVDVTQLSLPPGATVLQAVRDSGLLERHPGIDLASQKLGVWGKLRAPDDLLREGDRVEVYRPLLVDPKEARRQRYKSHRERMKKLP
ncbi:RnfH family protein [Piscinibacter sp.]|jgi:putative ubiquitin-RnfH superfamily antitoxin RatB of RatAB toxin-antitoxin module|uniref:RnfH family protein n=1 Tax=Piscinibacter sp. TaxID=1903157 RepID=UPI0035593E56